MSNIINIKSITPNATLNTTSEDREDQISDLLFELSTAHSYALMCDSDDAFYIEGDIREAIKLLEADFPSLTPVKLLPADFSRGMDFYDRMCAIEDLITYLERCLENAEEYGYYGTEVSGYIENALDTAKESLTFISEMAADEEEEELRYANSAYYKAAI